MKSDPDPGPSGGEGTPSAGELFSRLLADLPADGRQAALRAVVATLEVSYRAARLPNPAWLEELRKL